MWPLWLRALRELKMDLEKCANYGRSGNIFGPDGSDLCIDCFNGAIVKNIENKKITDNVINPPYYKRGGIESIEIEEAWELGYKLGNVLKYILRAGKKGDRLKDLKKAQWHLDREIQQEETRRLTP